jgi:hypothetical protein
MPAGLRPTSDPAPSTPPAAPPTLYNSDSVPSSRLIPLAATPRRQVQHAGVVSIGEPAPLPEELYRHNWTAVVETTQALERKRARAVHRTFTEAGSL